jgi:hypothetical protein
MYIEVIGNSMWHVAGWPPKMQQRFDFGTMEIFAGKKRFFHHNAAEP